MSLQLLLLVSRSRQIHRGEIWGLTAESPLRRGVQGPLPRLRGCCPPPSPTSMAPGFRGLEEIVTGLAGGRRHLIHYLIFVFIMMREGGPSSLSVISKGWAPPVGPSRPCVSLLKRQASQDIPMFVAWLWVPSMPSQEAPLRHAGGPRPGL